MPQYQGAHLLLVNQNFGCGSSREHAPQALMRWGIQAIMGESFAEIFAGNCTMLGIPTMTAPQAEIQRLQKMAKDNPKPPSPWIWRKKSSSRRQRSAEVRNPRVQAQRAGERHLGLHGIALGQRRPRPPKWPKSFHTSAAFSKPGWVFEPPFYLHGFHFTLPLCYHSGINMDTKRLQGVEYEISPGS